MQELEGKILLLESFGGTVAKIETYLCQLQQIGAFDKVAGILLGTFTEMEKECCLPTVETLVKRIVGEDLPIAVTRDIGHGIDSKAIVIGEELYLG
jgi:muramoyltetrapeptide carboxypeptidase LdcA involved in peptidoglycan recycling